MTRKKKSQPPCYILLSQHRGIRSPANLLAILISLLMILTQEIPSDGPLATTSYAVGVDGPSNVSKTSAIEH